MAGFFSKVKEKANIVASKMQKALVFIFLLFTYFVLLGISYPFVALFHRKLLWPGSKNADSFWIRAEGYGTDIEDYRRQS